MQWMMSKILYKTFRRSSTSYSDRRVFLTSRMYLVIVKILVSQHKVTKMILGCLKIMSTRVLFIVWVAVHLWVGGYMMLSKFSLIHSLSSAIDLKDLSLIPYMMVFGMWLLEGLCYEERGRKVCWKSNYGYVTWYS